MTPPKRGRDSLLTFLVIGVMLPTGFSTGTAGQSIDGIPDMSGKILTVTGPIDPSELGPTTMHEHIFINFTGFGPDGYLYRTGYRREGERVTAASELHTYYEPLSLKNLGAVRIGLSVNRENWVLTDLALAIKEVLHFRGWGGRSIVDVTSIGLGRDPQALMQVANSTGLNIVMGGGYYLN